MEKLAVIGCGTMGHSIALNAAWVGMQVKMYGIDANDIQNGLSGVNDKLNTLLKNDLVTKDQLSRILKNITGTFSLSEAVDGATFIIECIPEVLELKNDLFRKLDQMCGREVILATNTSGLSPSRIALNLKHPERTLATHFWNPAHLIPLVEVLRAEFTNDKTFNRAIDMLKFMKKKPIEVKKEVPGLVGNRLQFALFREAQYLLEQGIASKEDIDAAVTYSIGRRLPVTGPLLSADMGGLDVFASISDYLFKDLSNADQSSSNLKELVAQRHFGQKNGAGFYLWDGKFSEEMNQKREEQLIRFLKEDIN
ncbi:MAG TPA: 3-hydroxyacyl-CoA dehydrogenase family protein [Daejeonella sp.]|uniref:3-hydroxyacyl-CoA dehydrogenase family protein n=1 Tax=Daejeonella sp. TaxID=2805397 RepID=UPI002ED7D656